MSKNGTLLMPETIHYGLQVFKKVGEEAALMGKKVLVISDKVMEKLKYVERCKNNLSMKGIESAVYLGVESEPLDTYVSEALDIFIEEECDSIISLGGGSCIDTAKAVAILVTNGGNIEDYVKKDITVKPVPHIAIPTTAGTGSEATDVTVITNTKNDIKMMIKQPLLMPNVAIVDSLLTHSSPKEVTAATGIDALSHAVEAYLSKRSHPFTDMIARSAMSYISKNIITAYNDGENKDSRKNMSIGSLKAGIAFSNSSVALVHGMSRPIGALFGVPHGFSNAMLLPAVLEFNKDYCINRLADIGRIFDASMEEESDKDVADFAVQYIKNLCLKLNIPNLREWGIPEQDFHNSLAKMAEDALASGSPANNPRVPTKEEIKQLYTICYDYDFSTTKSQVNV